MHSRQPFREPERLDLSAILSALPEVQQASVATMPEIFRRSAISPVPVVSAINGHAFAGAGVLAQSI